MISPAGGERADLCVIGTGFGGAVTALRAAQAAPGARIVALEKGRRWRPEEFRQDMDFTYARELWDLFSGPSVVVAGGTGVGGGSLIYSQVSVRAPTMVFDLRGDDGARLWPAAYTRASLDPHYDVVERTLGVARATWNDAGGTPPSRRVALRDHAFADGLERLGHACDAFNSALRDCADCGWCSFGCRLGRKLTLTENYIPAAERAGVEVRPSSLVRRVEALDASGEAGYRVHYRDRTRAEERRLDARVLVVAAGAVGSAALLLASRGVGGLGEIPAAVGRNLSLNGDMAVAGVAPARTDTWAGKIDNSMAWGFLADEGFTLQCVHLPPAMAALGVPFEIQAPWGRWWGLAHKRYLRVLHRHFLPIGILGLDRSEGQVRLSRLGFPYVTWRTRPETARMWSAGVNASRRLVEALGGHLLPNTWETLGLAGTVHPLGACRMGERRATSALTPECELWGRRNLFVVDGAAVPAPLAVNTSLTVAAVAERVAPAIAERLRA
ncbi:MAG: GMC family oxidoreductase [Planctomycetes bacterium]|nr:GMC family oxidoreductase [Planctomycetota bacterium]